MCVHRTKEDSSMYKSRLYERNVSQRGFTRELRKLNSFSSFFRNKHWILATVLFLPICTIHLSNAVPMPDLLAQKEPDPIPVPGPVAPTSSQDTAGFINGFVSSLSMIIVSELGDKTFFIAAIMAMRHPRVIVFAGAITALALMTVLSAFFGYVTTVIPRIYTYYISTALFGLFGFKMLYDGCKMSDDEGAEELEEVQQDLRQREADESTHLMGSANESKSSVYNNMRRMLYTFVSRIYLQALTMTFLAEWGDRSQLATVVLAARENILGICIGGVLGHAICTGLAVVGGRLLAQRISVKNVTIIGGIVFLIFAIISLFRNPN